MCEILIKIFVEWRKYYRRCTTGVDFLGTKCDILQIKIELSVIEYLAV